MLELVQLELGGRARVWLQTIEREQWVGGWMKVVAGRVERALYGSWLPDSESDAATSDARQTRAVEMQRRGRESDGAAELDGHDQGAKWPRIEQVGGLGRMGWPVSC